jgi:hypothetical protein
MELIPYFLALLAWVGMALAGILLWPLSGLLRRLRRGRVPRVEARSEPTTAAVPKSPPEGDHDRAWRSSFPTRPYRGPLATLLAERGTWKEDRAQAGDRLALDPEGVPAHLLWIRCLPHDGDRREAWAEADRIGWLGPENRDRREAWFQEQTREAPGPWGVRRASRREEAVLAYSEISYFFLTRYPERV